jgi:hypothetical protein
VLTKTEKRTTEMALSKTITTPHGIEIQDAYHRITNIRFSYPADCVVTVTAYASEEKARSGSSPLDQYTFFISPDSFVGESTFIRGVYLSLKNYDAYKEAKDYRWL